MTDTIVKHSRAAVEALVEEGRAALASDDESELATWVLRLADFERRESDAWLANEGPSLSTSTLNELSLASEEEGAEVVPLRERVSGILGLLAQLLSTAEFPGE